MLEATIRWSSRNEVKFWAGVSFVLGITVLATSIIKLQQLGSLSPHHGGIAKVAEVKTFRMLETLGFCFSAFAVILYGLGSREQNQ